MKIKVYELLAAYEEFSAILNEQEEKKFLSTRASTYVRRAFMRLTGEYETFHKTQMECVREFGTINEDKSWKVEGEQLAAYVEKWGPIAKEEIDVDAFTLDLSLFDGTNFGDKRIQAILPFIKE